MVSVPFRRLLSVALVTFLIVGTTEKSLSQSANNANPSLAWINMIDNPKANYYEAVRSFDAYWAVHPKPSEEAEIINEKLSPREAREIRREERKLKKMGPAERQRYDYLAYQYKRFINWKREVFPRVQDDGSLISQP